MNGYVGSVSAPLAAGTRSAPSGMTDEEYRFEQPVSRVLKLFGLTVPALVIMLLTYIGLTEHVFGLSYALNRQMGRSFRRSLRVAYLLASSGAAALCHAVLLSRCALDGLEGVDSPLCPEVLLGERRCLAPSSMACLVAVLTLWVERVVAPALDLWGEGRTSAGRLRVRYRPRLLPSCGSPWPSSSWAPCSCCACSRRDARWCSFRGAARGTES